MTTQEKLNPITKQEHPSLRQAAFLAIFTALFIVLGGAAQGYPGDQWILPIDHRDGGGWYVQMGAGYEGTDAIEALGPDPVRRVYWALTGLSVSNTAIPFSTEQYTIEWFQPYAGASDWQPIESQFRGVDNEIWPIEPKIPWQGAYGQNHQWIAAQGSDGTPGTWTTTGPGPHTPDSPSYYAGEMGIYMWLTRGSWLYTKWDFSWSIDHTWSALRLTQVTITRPVIQSLTQSGTNFTLVWSAGGGGNYQVQYKTNLSQVSWINLGGTIPANGTTTSVSDVNPTEPSRFYRVQVLP
jgi:hypothetical protein